MIPKGFIPSLGAKSFVITETAALRGAGDGGGNNEADNLVVSKQLIIRDPG